MLAAMLGYATHGVLDEGAIFDGVSKMLEPAESGSGSDWLVSRHHTYAQRSLISSPFIVLYMVRRYGDTLDFSSVCRSNSK